MRRVAAISMVAYLAVLLLLTFLPLGDPESVAARQLNLVPLKTIGRALNAGVDSPKFALVLGNLAAFVPLGILVPVMTRKRSWLLVLVSALALSAAIELGQYVVSTNAGFAYRTTDIDDVILNVLGALTGYAGYLLFQAVRAKAADSRRPSRPR
jgi:glycopeptide antibiotics resistance protein